MQTVSQLKHKAIDAAKSGDWQSAIELNSAIIAERPDDVAALNRLGVAYLQTGNKNQAKEAFATVLTFDRTNLIAQKQLARIKTNHQKDTPTFTDQSFIEEPGKTKSVELHRLAGKNVLESLNPGQSCQMKLKTRYISILKADDSYIGALPEDISYRLSKLIQTGNTYSCRIQSISAKHCVVFIEEITRSAQNSGMPSFPTSKTSGTQQTETDEQILLGEKIPLQIVETDEDEERSYDDFEPDSIEE